MPEKQMGRPPSKNPKKVRFEIRLTEQEAALLTECADRLWCTRTDVLNLGIQKVKADLDKK